MPVAKHPTALHLYEDLSIASRVHGPCGRHKPLHVKLSDRLVHKAHPIAQSMAHGNRDGRPLSIRRRNMLHKRLHRQRD